MGESPDVPVGAYSDVYGFGRTCYYALLEAPDPDYEDTESLPEPWRKFLRRCTGKKLAHRLPDFTAVIAGLEVLKSAMAALKEQPAERVAEPRPTKKGSGRPDDHKSSKPRLFIKAKGVVAQGQETADGMLVFAGSQAVKEAVPSLHEFMLDLRNSLVRQGVLVAGPDCLTLTRDYAFDSPSTAAGVILGRSGNGRIDWKGKDGRTLKQLQQGKAEGEATVAAPAGPAARQGVEAASGSAVRETPTPTPSERKRRSSDKPIRMKWADDPDNPRAVASWKEVLIQATQKALATGLPPQNLPMPNGVDAAALRLPYEVRPGLFIETGAGSHLILQWLSRTLAHTPGRKGFLRIETASGRKIVVKGLRRTGAGRAKARRTKLRLPQARILKVLLEAKEKNEHLNRASISERAGFSAGSGTISAALNGLSGGNPTGLAHLGLLRAGLVEKVQPDIDGLKEAVYHITEAGVQALEEYRRTKELEELPALRDKENSTDKRDRKDALLPLVQAPLAAQDQPERQDLRKKFWEGLLRRPKAQNTRHATNTPGEYSGMGAGSGVRGLPFNYVVGRREGRVELWIDRGAGQAAENKAIFDRLRRHKDEIEAAFGAPLSWQRLDDKQGCRIAHPLTAGGYKSADSQWPEIHDAMIDAMTRLENALAPHLEQLTTQLTSEGA